MPDKKKSAAKKPAAKKPAAKKPDAPKASPAKADVKPLNHTPKSKDENQEIRAAVVLLFTKCNGEISVLLGKETYEKWGPPSGGLNPGEDPAKGAEREFVEEVGHDMPSAKHDTSFRYRNVYVKCLYTDTCVEAKIGPKAKKPNEFLELTHIPMKKLYDLLANPQPTMPLRAVFIAMMMDNRKEIEAFMSKLS